MNRNTHDPDTFKKLFTGDPSRLRLYETGLIRDQSDLQRLKAAHLSPRQDFYEVKTNELGEEIIQRLSQLEKLKIFILRETSNFISKIENGCKEKLREIDRHINFYNRCLSLNNIQEKPQMNEVLYNLSYKKLEILYPSLKKPSVFYKNLFVIEKYKIPDDIIEAKNYVLTLFPHLHQKLANITDLAISIDGKFTVVGKVDDKVIVFNNENSKIIQQYCGLSGTVISVAISNDSQLVIAGLIDQTVHVWNLTSTTPLKTFRSRCSRIIHVSFTNDFKYLACVGEQKADRIIEVRLLKTFEEVFKNGISRKWLSKHSEILHR